MLFDESARHGAIDDLYLMSIADSVAEYLRTLASDGPEADTIWRTAGYRFAAALAGRERAGRALDLARAFADGMRTYGSETASIGAPEFYDTKRADTLEEKAEKLLTLATHKGTGTAEAAAAALGFAKLFAGRELAIISRQRYLALGRALSRMTETINFIKREHPTIFTWTSRDGEP